MALLQAFGVAFSVRDAVLVVRTSWSGAAGFGVVVSVRESAGSGLSECALGPRGCVSACSSPRMLLACSSRIRSGPSGSGSTPACSSLVRRLFLASSACFLSRLLFLPRLFLACSSLVSRFCNACSLFFSLFIVSVTLVPRFCDACSSLCSCSCAVGCQALLLGPPWGCLAARATMRICRPSDAGAITGDFLPVS